MQNSKFFPEIRGNFGFGCMRLPMNGGKVNYDEFCRMADAFTNAGFNYFDTAHGYIGGQSETAYGFKEEGLIRHFGISFHDKADVLDMILTEHPEVEIVQIQFNYVDYEDASVEGRKLYEVCEKHGKPVIVILCHRGY